MMPQEDTLAPLLLNHKEIWADFMQDWGIVLICQSIKEGSEDKKGQSSYKLVTLRQWVQGGLRMPNTHCFWF